MTLKDTVIAICFTGSLCLIIMGGWDYMKGRILLYEEKVKIDKVRVTNPSIPTPEEELRKITKERNNGLLMFGAGFTGFFLIISYIQRSRKESNYPTYKTK